MKAACLLFTLFWDQAIIANGLNIETDILQNRELMQMIRNKLAASKTNITTNTILKNRELMRRLGALQKTELNRGLIQQIEGMIATSTTTTTITTTTTTTPTTTTTTTTTTTFTTTTTTSTPTTTTATLRSMKELDKESYILKNRELIQQLIDLQNSLAAQFYKNVDELIEKLSNETFLKRSEMNNNTDAYIINTETLAKKISIIGDISKNKELLQQLADLQIFQSVNDSLQKMIESMTTTTTTTPTTTTVLPQSPDSCLMALLFQETVGIRVIARNSQNNNAIPGAKAYVHLVNDDGVVTVADGVGFDAFGKLFIHVSSNGRYKVQVKADGFILSDYEVGVACTSHPCQIPEKLITLSPVMKAGQTRIMITWEKPNPRDVDTFVMAVKISDSSTCKTWYNNMNGCSSVSQDLDNTSGGLNGAETVTLLDNTVNSNYRYLVGINDCRFEGDGYPFLGSGASMTVTNGVQTVTKRLVGSGQITKTNGFYFFGCIDVLVNGQYKFTSAPAGTFFNGKEDRQWLSMMVRHCRA